MKVEITTTYLELNAKAQFRPSSRPLDETLVRRVEIPSPRVNHFFFTHVGRPWRWFSRLGWTFQEWKQWVEREEVSTWIGYYRNSPFGYFELEEQGTNVEIVFLGMLPDSLYFGRGLGGFLLTEAVNKAWDLNPLRVWVHTCTLDHPNALQNYLNRGFTLFKTVKEIETVPDRSDGIWQTPMYFKSLDEEERKWTVCHENPM